MSPGPSRTRLVLVHGSRLSASQWAPQVSRLAADPQWSARLDVATPDLPGHGTRVGEPFTLERAAGAIAAAVEAPGDVGPVVVAGHSLGGYAAMAYAARFPRRLDGLVLLGCAAVPRGAGAAAYRGVGALADRLGPQRLTRLNDRVLGRLYPEELLGPVLAGGYFFEPTTVAWLEVMAGCGPWLLREVDAPVLVAGGAFDQLMVDARRYARAAPRGRVAVVPRAGHFVGFDQPDAVTRLLAEFALSVGSDPDGTMRRS